MTAEAFADMLRGGHPNSLGRTEEVVAEVLADTDRIDELFDCYHSADAVVRLRTSSAVKRLARARPDIVEPWIEYLITEVAAIDQASTQWTLATLFDLLESRLDPGQKQRARRIMQHNLAHHRDWIVLNTTMQTLGDWARADARLARWLRPQLERLLTDDRGSVARKAGKTLAMLDAAAPR